MNKLTLIISVLIFGTIGIFVNYIPLPSGAIAFTRGAVGALCLILFGLIFRVKNDFDALKKNLLLLLLSGGAIGFNWILLFESYRHTTVATATLCYYMTPVFVMLVSPLLLKEKLTIKKLVCITVSLLGMVLVSGVITGASAGDDLLGILCGISAAVLYASVIIMNKKLGPVSAFGRTVVQLAAAAIVVLPYTLIAEKPDITRLTPVGLICLVCVGVVHTGLAYLLYFGSVEKLPVQTVAVISYIDPVVAIILSAFILSQPMDLPSIIGALMILAASLVAEWPKKNKNL